MMPTTIAITKSGELTTKPQDFRSVGIDPLAVSALISSAHTVPAEAATMTNSQFAIGTLNSGLRTTTATDFRTVEVHPYSKFGLISGSHTFLGDVYIRPDENSASLPRFHTHLEVGTSLDSGQLEDRWTTQPMQDESSQLFDFIDFPEEARCEDTLSSAVDLTDNHLINLNGNTEISDEMLRLLDEALSHSDTCYSASSKDSYVAPERTSGPRGSHDEYWCDLFGTGHEMLNQISNISEPLWEFDSGFLDEIDILMSAEEVVGSMY